MLLICSFSYGLLNLNPERDLSKNQPPIPPVPDKKKYDLELYFSNSNYSKLEVEKRIIISTELSEEKAIIEELIKGPRNKVLKSTIPPDTKLLSVDTTDGICYVNFSKEFLNMYPLESQFNEGIIIWSIVNSLTEVHEVHGVQILVEGNKIDLVEKYYSLNHPFFRNEELVKKVALTPFQTFNLFLQELMNSNYISAYERLEEKSKAQMDLLKFKLIMGNYASELKDYEINRYQTQKYSDRVVLVITYQQRKTFVSEQKTTFAEYWELIYEDNKWKIVLPL